MANVMVVDDEVTVRNLFKEILSDSNHVILEAGNGEEACEIVNNNSIALVVTDLVIPAKSGLELIIYLAENHPDMPIIAISGGGRYNRPLRLPANC